ncbi:ribbon-helix-helix domain-containing protein [Clostridium botulinum]
MAVSKDNIRIKITIPKNINEKLREKADKNQRSVSNYVYNLIVKDLENN